MNVTLEFLSQEEIIGRLAGYRASQYEAGEFYLFLFLSSLESELDIDRAGIDSVDFS